jgi:hypothetical protein
MIADPMNTRLLMRATALFLGAAGLAASFLPQEMLAAFGVAPVPVTIVLVQIVGAAYLGFAFLNWMAQGNAMGGIYSRPVAIGNFGHFTIGGLGLLKSGVVQSTWPVLAVAALYAVFAALFAYVAFAHSPATPGA